MSVALNHQQFGIEDAPPVVFLGSIGTDLTVWEPQAHALANRFRVIAVDLRGHGESPTPAGPYEIADLAGDVLALLDHLGLDTAHLVGQGLGGAIGQWLSARHPTRVATLSLLAPIPPPATPSAVLRVLEQARKVRADGVGALAETLVGRWFTPTLAAADPALVARHVAMVEAAIAEGVAASFEALARWDGRADLARIVAPTLLVVGAQDTVIPYREVAALAGRIATSQVHVLEPAGHLVGVEQAGQVSALLAAHFAGHTPLIAQRVAAVASGDQARRRVLGDAHVDAARGGSTEFTAPFQDFITRTAWGDIWSRPGLDDHARRLLTLAILTAVGNEHELDMHIRAALRAGLDPGELAEVFLHTAVYAGVPNSNRAFVLGKRALADRAEERGPRDDGSAS